MMWHKRIYPQIVEEREIERSIAESSKHFEKVTDPRTVQSEVNALIDDWIQIYEQRKKQSTKGTADICRDRTAKLSDHTQMEVRFYKVLDCDVAWHSLSAYGWAGKADHVWAVSWT